MKKPVKRLATKHEIDSLFEYLINSQWETSLNYASTIGYEDVKLGYVNFRKKQIIYYQEHIGNVIIVEHFEEYNILLYCYLYTHLDEETKDNGILSNKIFKLGNTFKDADEWDYFNIDQIITEFSVIKNSSVGRPKRPTEKNILKTHNIRILIKDGILVDDACKKENLSKSTYYRVSKWLIANTIFSNKDFIPEDK